MLHRIVDAGLNSRHHLEGTLQNCQSCTNWGLGRHVTDLQVSSRSKTASLFNDIVEQRVQNLARLLVGERHNVVADGAAGYVYVPKLRWGYGGVVPFNS